jgi:hypothetical protein
MAYYERPANITVGATPGVAMNNIAFMYKA